MSMSMEQIREFARQQWGEGLEPSQGNILAAAVGLVSNWYRNTNAVETLAHAEGPWTDEDMLRQNAWATESARLAINAVAERVDDLDAVEDVLEGLLDDLVAMLPTEGTKSELRSEKQGAPALATDWIAAKWARQLAGVPHERASVSVCLVGHARVSRGRRPVLRSRPGPARAAVLPGTDALRAMATLRRAGGVRVPPSVRGSLNRGPPGGRRRASVTLKAMSLFRSIHRFEPEVTGSVTIREATWTSRKTPICPRQPG